MVKGQPVVRIVALFCPQGSPVPGESKAVDRGPEVTGTLSLSNVKLFKKRQQSQQPNTNILLLFVLKPNQAQRSYCHAAGLSWEFCFEGGLTELAEEGREMERGRGRHADVHRWMSKGMR